MSIKKYAVGMVLCLAMVWCATSRVAVSNASNIARQFLNYSRNNPSFIRPLSQNMYGATRNYAVRTARDPLRLEKLKADLKRRRALQEEIQKNTQAQNSWSNRVSGAMKSVGGAFANQIPSTLMALMVTRILYDYGINPRLKEILAKEAMEQQKGTMPASGKAQ